MSVQRHGAAAAPPAAATPALPWAETTIESVVGNRLGAPVYRRWVDRLQLVGDER